MITDALPPRGRPIDLAGTGWSEDVELPRSSGEVIDELRALLGQLGVPAPYVLVRHSLGGACARRYAQRFPAEVAGLLLLDPRPRGLGFLPAR